VLKLFEKKLSNDQVAETKIRIFERVIIVIGILLVLLPISPLNMPLAHRDSGVFLYMGSQILRGDLPYVDVWDHKPPVIFYINALGLFFGNGSKWGVWFVELVFLFFAASISYKLFKKAFGRLPSIFSLFLWLFGLNLLIFGGNFTTEYTLPFQFACMWLVYESEKHGFIKWRGFLVGALCSIVFLTKQNAIGIGISIGLYLIFSRFAAGQFKKLVREFIAIMLGSLAILLPVVIYFKYHNALYSFWNIAFGYNFSYLATVEHSRLVASMSIKSRIASIYDGVYQLSTLGLPQFALVGWSGGLSLVLFWKQLRQDLRTLILVCLIDLPLELILASISGRTYQHYFMALLPIFSFFAALAFWTLIEGIIRIYGSQKVAFFFTFCVLFVLSLFNLMKYRNVVAGYPNNNTTSVLTFIDQVTTDDDTVLIWGAEAATNFFSGRVSPSRFVYQYPLFTPGYVNEELIEEFLNDITQNKPALIIDTKNPKTPFLKFDVTSEKIENRIQFIRSHYLYMETLDSWDIYQFEGQR